MSNKAELEARVAELEAENETLKAAAEQDPDEALEAANARVAELEAEVAKLAPKKVKAAKPHKQASLTECLGKTRGAHTGIPKPEKKGKGGKVAD